ncbi:PWWP domain-containing protein [Cordyceps fumosorosea ARSEF 2679]|uniref:PWWP domain-containing protein n=1 Tax=Cordyceps fumosorosea (strain ARSEF 2679) TaxID=1081104 RepID=A0A167XDM6_CORFA|nr:PWWP domain-containing protein [Cordyceps fumosorosea ARSEF 2679]OAA64847.1 PWWP domain-containing protein [Cordyceps fumosorosea ARSEF 2679]
MADTPSTVPDAVASAATEQTASTEPAAAPASGEVADEAKTTTEAPKEDAEKPAGEFHCVFASRVARSSRILQRGSGAKATGRPIAHWTPPPPLPVDATKTEDVATTAADAEKKEAAEAPEAAPAAAATETPNSKKNNNRRKSVGGGLSRKGSKARLTHTDAKPGDHFLVKLKGFPPWPVIICDEDMLPPALTSTRPVSAAKADGSYADAYADGGKRVQDRTFPVMYLSTNEFGWAANTTLTELTAEKASNSINDKMRKDLREAFELAADQHPVEHYKEVLAKFEEELIAQQKAFEEEEAARMEAAATPKKSKKSKKADDEDVEMADVDSVKPKSKKRKAEDETSTPQRSDSVKKPKIKLNTSSTPKANGTPSKKAESAVKTKADKKAKDVKKAKEPKMTPEEKRERKQREVFFLRHKLQKGLLSKDAPPVESEMKSMSEYLTALENFTDLEASIIRETKINKVLKAILKMESIPSEEEFTFKKRSQGLLDKWNKLLASAAAAAPAGNTNGVNGSGEKKDTNGATEGATEEKSLPEKLTEAKDEAEPAEPVKAEEKAPEAIAAATD